MNTYNSTTRKRIGMRWLPVTAVLFTLLSATSSFATVVTLQNGNSRADFRTSSSDPGNKGLYDWIVDGTDHMFEQWFWHRVGATGPETSIDSLIIVDEDTLNLDGVTGDEFLRTVYRNASISPTYEMTVHYTLTGATPGSQISAISERIFVRNLTNAPLDFHFFQYADFDLGGTPNDDDLVITGTPRNTAHQTDALFQVAETVVTPPATHYQATASAAALRALLTDASPTTLADISGPVSGDAAWAFQWDYTIPPRQSFIISKDKILLADPPIPEPSTMILAAIGLALCACRRFKLIK